MLTDPAPTIQHSPVTVAVQAQNSVGESPVWSAAEQALYWVDILKPAVYRWHPATGAKKEWSMPAAVGSIGLCEQGGLVLSLRNGFHHLNLDTGAITAVGEQPNPESHIATNRLNDGKVSPEGRFVVGSMDDRPAKEAVASLYSLGGSTYQTLATGFQISNGLAWSPDGRTLYHSDSRAATVWAHDYDPATGQLANRRVFIHYQPQWGKPDGAAVDVDGCYWSCGIRAGRLNRFDPSGQLMSHIDLPIMTPTMPCFGGPDLTTIYITSLRENLSLDDLVKYPLAGSVFQVDVGVAGQPVGLFG